MPRTASRTVTDDLLEVAVRIKRDAGVDHAEIQGVIDRFACHQHWEERTGGIGFPLVEDIPQSARSEFLAMLWGLSSHAGSLLPRISGRAISANEIWPSRIA